ncbi:MAG TPA: molybdate ABC transporter substrate-binding protein [Stellaceae bacterium]|jgi:molybdate transport system substrate-binding protein|nr:molybdate ABC transporter substrate-binding protein [Stellaceae bacterium]
MNLARFRLVGAALALTLGLVVAAPAAFADDVLVFAAASLKNALDDAITGFAKSGGAAVKVSYAASSALAKQIDSGAPADIFISADPDWMNDVQKNNAIKPETRFDFLSNVLVLVEPADSAAKVDIKPGFPLATMLGDNKLAMADPDAVPAGKYGKAALQKLGVWDAVEGKVARAEDVRAALLFVSRKEAPFGIVYQTDAAADPGVKIAGVFPADTYPPIIYPAALTASSKNPDAAKFLAYLHSDAAKPFFTKQGFTILSK